MVTHAKYPNIHERLLTVQEVIEFAGRWDLNAGELGAWMHTYNHDFLPNEQQMPLLLAQRRAEILASEQAPPPVVVSVTPQPPSVGSPQPPSAPPPTVVSVTPQPPSSPGTTPPSAPPPPVATPASAIHSGSLAELALWRSQLVAAARYAGIPVTIEWGVYGLETRFGTYVGYSSAGAAGLMQFLAPTARQYNYPYTNYPNAAQSQSQFTSAAIYLRDLLHQWGNWDAAIRAYSGGGYGLAEVYAKAASNPLSVSETSTNVTNVTQYANPLLGCKVTPGRIDQGVDFHGTGRLKAIADCKIHFVRAPATGWPGNFIEYQITAPGPLNDAYIYYAEGITPIVYEGQTVKAGFGIGDMMPGWGAGIEMGLSSGSDLIVTWSYEHDGPYRGDTASGSYATEAGIWFNQLLHQLGAPTGNVDGPIYGANPPFDLSGVGTTSSGPGAGNPATTFTSPSSAAQSYYFGGTEWENWAALGRGAAEANDRLRRMVADVSKIQYATITGPQT